MNARKNCVKFKLSFLSKKVTRSRITFSLLSSLVDDDVCREVKIKSTKNIFFHHPIKARREERKIFSLRYQVSRWGVIAQILYQEKRFQFNFYGNKCARAHNGKTSRRRRGELGSDLNESQEMLFEGENSTSFVVSPSSCTKWNFNYEVSTSTDWVHGKRAKILNKHESFTLRKVY